jgi:hypothetical protein
MEPGAADAHIRSGVIAVDYRVTVSAVLPPFATAIKVQVSESDRALSLTARQGHLVVVLGYSGEAFLRIDSAGVSVNTASATAVSTGLVDRRGRAPGREALWRTHSDGQTIVWHDARLRRPRAGVEHRRWSIPLVIDGDRTALEGETRIVRPPSLWLWFGLGALFAASFALLVALGGAVISRRAVGACAALAGAATIVTAAGFALDPTASTGRWVEGADEVLFAAVGIVVLARAQQKATKPRG